MSERAALDAREERFCREYVRRPVGKSAAKFAGYDASDLAEAAYRLLVREDIQDRIAALRHELAWRQCHDSDAVLAKLQAVYELALEKEQYYAAVRAVALQARIAVLVDERGRATQRRRERPVTWAWDGKPTVAEQDPMQTNANERQSFEPPVGSPPHPALSSPEERVQKEYCDSSIYPPLHPRGWRGSGEAGAVRLPTNANRCQSMSRNVDRCA